MRPCGRLLASHTGDPGLKTRDRAFEGLHFARIAAGDARLDTAMKAINALGLHQGRQRLGLRIDESNTLAVALFEALQKLVGLLVQPSGIDAEDVDLGQVRGARMRERMRLFVPGPS